MATPLSINADLNLYRLAVNLRETALTVKFDFVKSKSIAHFSWSYNNHYVYAKERKKLSLQDRKLQFRSSL